jgi:hypothetical protein
MSVHDCLDAGEENETTRRHASSGQSTREFLRSDKTLGQSCSEVEISLSIERSRNRCVTGGRISTGLKVDDAKQLKGLEREN